MPRFNSVTNKDISRETGFVAVETRTNVEVNELNCDGLSMIDTREVPAKLNSMAVNPLLLCYKFVAPEFSLALDIKKHQDVEVLIAVVDSAFFTATYSGEGSAMFRMVLLIRNTQKQYIRVTLPSKDCEIWSTLVAGSAVKPALDGDGKVMIPLKKSSKSDSKDSHNAFQVEFIYLVKSPAMTNRSTLSIPFPYCDIPVNQLFVNVFLPDSFRYGEFEGMREVRNWTKSLPSAPSSSPSSLVSVDKANNFRFELSKNAKSNKQDDAKSKGGRVAGVLPVRIDMPQVGQQFRFEQLGASSTEHIVLTVEYRRLVKGCCKQRSVNSCGCCC
jgi:hypothetical protein